MSEEDYATTEKVVRDFGAPGGPGEKLQDLLESKTKFTDNWVSRSQPLSSVIFAFQNCLYL